MHKFTAADFAGFVSTMKTVSPLAGSTATTVWGEHGTVIGPAKDPDRCTFLPDGDPTVVETFTPRTGSLTFD